MKASDITAAMKLRERDMRARMMADSCVAIAMQELRNEGLLDERQPEEHNCRRFAQRVASLATALLVSGIYLGDEEIRVLREENERLKEMAFERARTEAPRLIVDAPR